MERTIAALLVGWMVVGCAAGASPGGADAVDGEEEVAPGIVLLFQGVEELGREDRVVIFAALPLQNDPERPDVLLDSACSRPVEHDVELRDLDEDGAPEVIVVLASTCLYGGTGVGTTLFIRDRFGAFRPNLGFPGVIEQILPNRRMGFPDLLMAGMTGCQAVWGWDGTAYEHIRNEPRTPGACDYLPR